MAPSRPLQAAWSLLATLLCLPQAGAQTEFHRRLEARPDGAVEILNVAGSITVVGWDRNEIEVSGVLRRGAGEIRVSSRGGTIGIEVGRGPNGGGSAEIEVRLPLASRLSVESVSADVRVSGVEGDLALESVSGSLSVDGRPRSVDAETISGNVEVHGATSRVAASTVNGTIVLHGGVEIAAESVSGGVRVSGVEGVVQAEIETVSGRIEFEGSLAPGADLALSSHNGSILLALPAELSARFEVSSFSGRIENDLGPPARRQGLSPAHRLEFVVGSGDARVRVESFAGGIVLRKIP